MAEPKLPPTIATRLRRRLNLMQSDLVAVRADVATIPDADTRRHIATIASTVGAALEELRARVEDRIED